MMASTSFVDCSGQKFSPNAIVSKDGTGNFKTLAEAVNAIPSTAKGRYTIFVKEGVYEENVTINRSEVTLIGDGKGKTIIRSFLNAKDGGVAIGFSGAVIVKADNFIGKCMTFENASGKDKGQAVALMSEGDKSAFFLCEFSGYQDTLYVKGGRQFFRECDIYGTVDFIFGDAAMVVQKCNIYFRDTGYMTAQGRADKTKNTAIAIDKCVIQAAAGFDPSKSKKAFLGRPWKDFSRTVVMRSEIGDVIDPAGWAEWDGRSRTAECIEYANTGDGHAKVDCMPGEENKCRVKWPGFKLVDPDKGEQVMKAFSVAVFIDGAQWLPATGIPFDPDV